MDLWSINKKLFDSLCLDCVQAPSMLGASMSMMFGDTTTSTSSTTTTALGRSLPPPRASIAEFKTQVRRFQWLFGEEDDSE